MQFKRKFEGRVLKCEPRSYNLPKTLTISTRSNKMFQNCTYATKWNFFGLFFCRFIKDQSIGGEQGMSWSHLSTLKKAHNCFGTSRLWGTNVKFKIWYWFLKIQLQNVQKHSVLIVFKCIFHCLQASQAARKTLQIPTLPSFNAHSSITFNNKNSNPLSHDTDHQYADQYSHLSLPLLAETPSTCTGDFQIGLQQKVGAFPFIENWNLSDSTVPTPVELSYN